MIFTTNTLNNINKNYFNKNSWCPLSTTTERRRSKTSYATLSALRKMKRIAPFNIRKHVCESLVMSKLDYCSSVFDPLTIINKGNYRKCKFLVLHLFLIDTAQRQMHFHWGGYQLKNVLG